MRTLLVESTPGSGVAAEAELVAAGVEVVRCRERSAPDFPCREILDRGSCPLTGATRPDVVLVARSSADRAITVGEAGVGCAMRHGVPVVVDHDPVTGANPFGHLADVVAGSDRVAACEAAVAAAHDRAAAPLVAEVVRLLERAGADDVAVTVSLVRDGSGCRITVTVPADAEVADGAIAVRVHDLHRRLDGDGEPFLVEVGVRRRERRQPEPPVTGAASAGPGRAVGPS